MVWLAVRRLRETGEQVCDDSVVELLGSFEDYAETLIGAVQGLKRRRTVGLAASMACSSRIESRVRRILALAGNVSPRTGRVTSALYGLTLAGCAGLVATSSVQDAAPGRQAKLRQSMSPAATPLKSRLPLLISTSPETFR